MNQPTLIEPGVKYFLCETLKNCHKKKLEFSNSILNISLFVVFCFTLGSILYYCYKTKNTEIKQTSNEEKQQYIMALVDKIQTQQKEKEKEQQKMNGTLITDLPNFDNEFNIQMKKYI